MDLLFVSCCLLGNAEPNSIAAPLVRVYHTRERLSRQGPFTPREASLATTDPALPLAASSFVSRAPFPFRVIAGKRASFLKLQRTHTAQEMPMQFQGRIFP